MLSFDYRALKFRFKRQDVLQIWGLVSLVPQPRKPQGVSQPLTAHRFVPLKSRKLASL
jgi:hypothetical protein